LVSITSYREYDSDFRDDSDLSPNDMFDVGRIENLDQFSQEIRLASPRDQRLSWILGAYYYEEDLESYRDIRLGPAFPGIVLPPTFQERAETNVTIDNESWALFGTLSFDLSNALTLDLGLRYTDEVKDLFYEQVHTEVVFGLVGGFALVIPATTDDYDEGEFSGDVSLSYTFAPDHVGYLKYSRGFKAGGFQSDVISPPPNTPPESLDFAPEFVDSYEIGYKSIWLDKRLSLDLSAFWLDFEDKQERVNTGISFVISNAASVESYGAEMMLNYSPDEYWDISASAGWLDATYDEFPNGGGLGIDFEGNKLAGAPEYTGSFNIQYSNEVPWLDGVNGFARFEVDYNDGYYTEPSNDEARQVESHTIVNARLGLEDFDGRWGVYLWGKNLTDDTVLGGGVNLLGEIVGRSINIGRVYGLELRFAYH
jgi:iron complex outermembrane receptor protein